LTDRGTEFCGSESHEYELYLAVEDIDHTITTGDSYKQPNSEHRLIAVGTPVTGRPPHRSVRAEFPHTAPTSGI